MTEQIPLVRVRVVVEASRGLTGRGTGRNCTDYCNRLAIYLWATTIEALTAPNGGLTSRMQLMGSSRSLSLLPYPCKNANP